MSPDETRAIVHQVAAELLQTIAEEKVRFLAYVRECDHDPTLVKVAYYAAHVALREIGQSLSALGHSPFAMTVLDGRKNVLTPATMLAVLDVIAGHVHKAFPEALPSPESFEPGTPRTLAEIRAGLLVRTVCDEAGEPIFSEADIPALIEKSPEVLDRLYTTAARLSRIPLSPNPLAGEPDTPAAQAAGDQVPKAKKPKRSTEQGEGRAKIIAALTKHHQYAKGGCLNQEPIGNNELAKAAGVSASTASAFFSAMFAGHTKYKALCRDSGRLAAALKLLNNEFTPHDLYGRRPADEDDRDDDG